MKFKNSVLHGDCISLMQRMPAASVDLIVTDPPYLVDYVSRDGRSIANDRKSDWIVPAFTEAYRVLKDDSLCVSFYGWHKADAFLEAWRAVGFKPVGHFVAVKKYSSSSKHLEARHECAYLLAKGDPPLPKCPISDVLPWKYTGNHRHPTEKPVAAIMPLIEAFSRPKDIVLDPFAGSGTVAVTAFQMARRYIAIEKSKEYHRIARGRLWHEHQNC